jgi:4'-phosphopantetheinyl transferase
MSILLPFNPLPGLEEPLWLPAPDSPHLPVNELHIWRAHFEESSSPRFDASTGWPDNCPVDRDRAEAIKVNLFRKDIMARYLREQDDGASLPILAGPSSGLRVAMAQCDHLALIAVSRDVRRMGLDVERVREDIPIEEMADGFLDASSQWALRITWSLQEKAWKFFQFWTSNEACAQARPKSLTSQACRVSGFSPEADFIAALAVDGGPDAGVRFWDWSS